MLKCVTSGIYQLDFSFQNILGNPNIEHIYFGMMENPHQMKNLSVYKLTK